MRQYVLITHAPRKGPFDRSRLFEDFLLHVVTVVTLIRRIVALVQRNCATFNNILVMPEDGDFSRRDFDELSFFQKNEPVGDWSQGLGIRSDIVFADAQADDQRATQPCRHHSARMILIDDRNGVGAFQLIK